METGAFAETAVEGTGAASDITANSLKGTLGAKVDMVAGKAGTF